MKFSYSRWPLRILWLALYLSHAFLFRTEAAAYEIYENSMHTKYSGFRVNVWRNRVVCWPHRIENSVIEFVFFGTKMNFQENDLRTRVRWDQPRSAALHSSCCRSAPAWRWSVAAATYSANSCRKRERRTSGSGAVGQDKDSERKKGREEKVSSNFNDYKNDGAVNLLPLIRFYRHWQSAFVPHANQQNHFSDFVAFLLRTITTYWPKSWSTCTAWKKLKENEHKYWEWRSMSLH